VYVLVCKLRGVELGVRICNWGHQGVCPWAPPNPSYLVGRSALNNDRVRVEPEYRLFLPGFCGSVYHTDRAEIRISRFLEFLDLSHVCPN
jgi:hypothetical protein